MGTITKKEYFTNSTIRGNGQWHTRINRCIQAAPIDREIVLPYRRLQLSMGDCTLLGKIIWPLQNGLPIYFDVNHVAGLTCANPVTYASTEASRATELAVNKARSKFMSCMHERAEWTVNLAERKEALSMVGKRSAQVGRFLCGTANFALNPRSTVKRLYQDLAGLTSPSGRRKIRRAIERWRSGAKSLAALWLELHFGWEPLVKDIYASYEVLTQEPVFSSIKKGSGRIPYTEAGSNYRNSKSYWKWMHTGTAEAWVFGDIIVTDPNLYRTQRLGLTNPASWLWQLMPWSFVADWFANLGTWLAQWDETLGVSVTNAGYSKRVRTTVDGSWVEPSGSCKGTSKSFYFERFVGLPTVKLTSYIFKGFSAVRGATAIALLVQFFGRDPDNIKPNNKYYKLFDWNSMTRKFYRYEA